MYMRNDPDLIMANMSVKKKKTTFNESAKSKLPCQWKINTDFFVVKKIIIPTTCSRLHFYYSKISTFMQCANEHTHTHVQAHIRTCYVTDVNVECLHVSV